MRKLFDPDFLSARLASGETAEFTNAESRLLRYFADHPNQVLSRQQILDAVSKPGSDKNDRSIDHLINRVRRKLQDNIRTPEYIGTRYGGGYVWLANDRVNKKTARGNAHSDFAVGPLRGLASLGSQQDAGRAFAEFIRSALASHFNTGAPSGAGGKPDLAHVPKTATARLLIDLSYFSHNGKDECVVVCRRSEENHIVHVERIGLVKEAPPFAGQRRVATALVKKVVEKNWQHSVEYNATFSPLPIAMLEASLSRHDAKLAWKENESRVGNLCLQHPDDPATKLMRASHIFSGHVNMGYEWFLSGGHDWRGETNEIERLVLEILDFVQSNPELAIMAAKLLYYTNPDYKHVALDLARQAHMDTREIATSLVILGQLEGFAGNTTYATDLLHQATLLCEHGTRFHVYVLILHCQTLVAGGRKNRIAGFLPQIYSAAPRARPALELSFTNPDRPSLYAKGIMLTMTRRKATALLRYKYQISTRLFKNIDHQANDMRTPLSLCIRRFGRSIIPPELQDRFPSLLE